MKEKMAADNDNKTPATESGNDGSSEDSNDSSSRESKDPKVAMIKESNGDVTVAPSSTNDGLAKLRANLTTTDENCDWNGADQSLFRTLHKMYTANYCAIALIMLTKTCKQVRLPKNPPFMAL